MTSSRTGVLGVVLGFQAVTAIPTAAQPSFVGHYVEGFGYSLEQAGFIASAEGIGLACGQLIVFLWFTRAGWDLRRSVAVALGVFAAAQVLSCWPQYTSLFTSMRLLSGVAGGGVIASTAALYIAGLEKPDRAFAAFYGVLFVVGPLGLWLLPGAFAVVGAAGVYLMLAGAALLALLLIGHYPRRRGSALPDVAIGPRTSAQTWLAAFILLSLFVNFVSNGGVWVYMERIAESAGLAPELRARYLALGMATGVAGALAAAIAAGRLQRMPAILLGQLLLLGSYAILLQWRHASAFLAAVILLNVAGTFFTPFYLSALAKSDPTGRAATLGVFAMGLGYGFGPGTLALFISDGSFHAPVLAAAMLLLGSCALLAGGLLVERRHPIAERALFTSYR